MIDEYWTWIFYGYHSDDLSYGSVRPIIAVCDECYRYRVAKKQNYCDICRHCAKMVKYLSDNTRSLLSKSHIGSTHSDETRIKMSKSMTGLKHPPLTDDHKCKISKAFTDRVVSDETRRRLSATWQGIPYNEWQEFATEKEYCEKFDENCREHNRNKYGRYCFVCDKNEETNKRKLSVHHVDMNKNQGCDKVKWALVPLCSSCHQKAHFEPLKSRLKYLLNL